MSNTKNTDRENLFTGAKAVRQKEKEEQEQRKNNSGNYTKIRYGALRQNEYSSFRLLGNPASKRNGDATSPMHIHYSMILGDNDKQFRCVWPAHPTKDIVGKNWFLARVYSKIMQYQWDDASQTQIFHNKKLHPAIWNRVGKNNKPDNRFETGWFPTASTVFNVIDRSQMDWHKENKHTVMLAKKVSESGNGNFFYEPGVPTRTVYKEAIWDEIVTADGDFQNYDIAILKLEEDPWYRVYNGVHDFDRKLSGKSPLFEGNYVEVASAPLTEEELSWERYDMDAIYSITTYSKIQRNLAIFIASVDEVFNTHYVEELANLVEVEKKERDATKATSAPKAEPIVGNVMAADTFAEDAPATDDFIAEEKVAVEPATKADTSATEKAGSVFDDVEDGPTPDPAPVRTRKPAAEKAEEDGIDWDVLGESLDGIATMSEENKANVESYDADKGTFVYKGDQSLFSCPTTSCSMKAPDSFDNCPACGVAFE